MPNKRKRYPARYRCYIDPWSQRYCFTCPLPDCVGTNSQACPIFQAKAAQSPSPIGRGARGEGKSPSANGRAARGEGNPPSPVCAQTPSVS